MIGLKKLQHVESRRRDKETYCCSRSPWTSLGHDGSWDSFDPAVHLLWTVSLVHREMTVGETVVGERPLWLILQLFTLSFKHWHARFLPVYKRSWMWWRPQTDYLSSWCRYSRHEKAVDEVHLRQEYLSGGEGWGRHSPLFTLLYFMNLLQWDLPQRLLFLKTGQQYTNLYTV